MSEDSRLSSRRAYLVYLELTGTSPKLQKEQCKGAFVTCVVAASCLEEAIAKAKEVLCEDQYVLVDIDKVMEFEAEEWGHDNEISELAGKTLTDGQTRYSEFNLW